MDDITVLLRELGTEVGYGHIVDKQSRAGDLFFGSRQVQIDPPTKAPPL